MNKIYCVLLLFFMTMTEAISQNTVHIDQIGNNNSISVNQNDSGKTVNIQLRGDFNDIQSDQIGTGSHSSTLTSGSTSSSNNVIRFQQSGAGNHTATLDIFGSSGGNQVLFNQSGSASKTFNMTIIGQGVSATVTQTNPTVPDVGSMTINCVSPPCSGFSYTRN